VISWFQKLLSQVGQLVHPAQRKELDTFSLVHVESEIALHATLVHPAITTFYGSFEDELGNIYLVLEYAKSGDVFSLLQKHQGGDDELSEGDICERIIRPVAAAVAHMHERNIMHRDIKPENVFAADDEERGCCKLADMGFAEDFGTHRPVSRLGTLQYMAPEVMECDRETREQLRAERKAGYGPAADCWAIGVLAFECLFGRAPFPGEDIQDTYDMIHDGVLELDDKRELSEEAKDFILSCLDVRPDMRLTAKQMLAHSWVAKFAKATCEKSIFDSFDSVSSQDEIDSRQMGGGKRGVRGSADLASSSYTTSSAASDGGRSEWTAYTRSSGATMKDESDVEEEQKI
jgi:serine/threonine protein kinase